MKNQLIQTDDLTRIVEKYTFLKNNYDNIVDKIKEYNIELKKIIATDADNNNNQLKYLDIDEKFANYNRSETYLKKLNTSFMYEVLNFDKIKKLLSQKQINKIYKDIEQLAHRDEFEINLKSATNLIDSLLLNSNNLLLEQLKSCYLILTSGFDYKTNQHYKTIGGYKIDKKSKIYATVENIQDVICCFNLLSDKKVENTSNLYNHMRERTDFDCDFFTAKFYKNGYAHLIYKDKDLVNLFNEQVGKNFNWIGA